MSNAEESHFREFIHLARWAGYLLDAGADQLLAACERNPGTPPGSVAVQTRILKREQAERIRKVQEAGGPAPDEEEFADLLVRNKFVSEQDLWACIAAQGAAEEAGRRPFLAVLAVERDILTREEAGAALRKQLSRGRGLLTRVEPAAAGPRSWMPASPGRLALVVGVFAVAILLLVRYGTGNASPTVDVVCDSCRRVMTWRVDQAPPRCSGCGKPATMTRLFCGSCRVPFSVRIEYGEDGTLRLARCPDCGSLEHVSLKDVLRPYK